MQQCIIVSYLFYSNNIIEGLTSILSETESESII